VPAICRRGTYLCVWEPGPGDGDEDVSGNSIVGFSPNFDIAHPNDPAGGHLVRLRFTNEEDERNFLIMLKLEGEAIAARP
jgi:hypothetical protein